MAKKGTGGDAPQGKGPSYTSIAPDAPSAGNVDGGATNWKVVGGQPGNVPLPKSGGTKKM